MNKNISKVVDFANSRGLKVRFVGKKLGEYAAMNSEAACLVGYKGCPKDTLLVDKRRPLFKQERDLKHEIIERHKLINQDKRYKKMSKHTQYLKAHLYAQKHQSDSITKIKGLLK